MQPGNILVRGPPCFGGYENSASATEESFVTIEGTAGWFNTGDMGYMDRNSYLFISGRSKEIINRGGETISPFEIEEAVVQHPLVKETLAFSAPHATFQETIGIVVVTPANQPRVDLPALWKYLDSKLHRSKWPQIIVYMNALPKNAANKILRIRLGERMKLDDIDEESAPSTRLLEGACPPVGAPLTQPIAVEPIVIDTARVEEFLRCKVGVRQAVLVRVDLPFKPKSLVAFVESHAEIVEALERACEEGLHKYEIPVSIHALDTMPMMATQPSVPDKAFLVEMALRLHFEMSIVSPRNPMESKIEAIWRQFLGSGSVVSVVDSFFDLGGDSLKAGQLVNAMRKKLKIQLSVGDLFTNPTIEAMANQVSKLKIIGSPSLSAKAIGDKGEKHIVSTLDSPLLSPAAGYGDAEEKFGGSWEHSMNLSSTALPCLVTQLLPAGNTHKHTSP
jgi:acyl carrier protein